MTAIVHKVSIELRKNTYQKVQKNTISKFVKFANAKPVTHKYSYENK